MASLLSDSVSLFKTGGKTLIKTITIAEAHFEKYKDTPDFIQLYIFPGGMLPTPSIFCDGSHKAGLKLLDAFEFGQDYAKTLHHWLLKFEEKKQEVLNNPEE